MERLKASARERGLWNLFLPALSSLANADYAAVAEAAGLHGDILPIYVVLRDVPEQNWGFSGKPLSFDQLQTPPPGATPL